MEIKLNEIKIRDVAAGYKDSAENGVVGYGGKLNIRPAFQREFVYNDKQRDEVINTVKKGFPLNVMYWVKGEDDNFELLDGQQRTISICQYINGDYCIDYQYFHNLTPTEQDQILDYPLMVYICEGTDKEKLDWFKIINIASVELTQQELRNAIYTGEWLTDAKRYFSKNGCPAYKIAKDYMGGKMIRQEYLETAIEWIAAKEGKGIEQYMAEHQHDKNANALWLYFKSVIDWVQVLFPKYRKEMKGIEWGILYNKYKDNAYDSNELEDKIKTLMIDEDVTKKSGIYPYLLGESEKCLNIRKFPDSIIRATYEKQNGICVKCQKHFELTEMDADHITPWSLGGKTTADNCQMLCKNCNRTKSAK